MGGWPASITDDADDEEDDDRGEDEDELDAVDIL